MDYLKLISNLKDEIYQSSTTLSVDENERVNELNHILRKVGESWSGSWIGYHANIYYEAFAKPPVGANFSFMDGLYGVVYSNTKGDWVEYSTDEVNQYIRARVKDDDISDIQKKAKIAQNIFEYTKSEILSLLCLVEEKGLLDNYLESLKTEISGIKIITQQEILRVWRPKSYQSRDEKAMYAGLRVPPHLQTLSLLGSLIHVFDSCENLYQTICKIGNHMEKKIPQKPEINKTKIFIGHGNSTAWRDLKDFLNERLNLSYDEFNRVPIAGLTNINRLAQMLDEAGFAFLVMTAEDEQNDGRIHARQNVIHEVGLFQGKLGFEKAIVLLEAGCEEFTNIQGLGQIRFPKGNIGAKFEDIRRVLEREGIIG